MNRLSLSETLLHDGAYGALQLGEALSAAAEARRLRGAYEQFAEMKNREGVPLSAIQSGVHLTALDGELVTTPWVTTTRN